MYALIFPSVFIGGVRGDETALYPLGRHFRQFFICGRSDELGQLGRIGNVERLGPDVRLRRGGAPPMQIVAAAAPGTAVELGQRTHQDPRRVGTVDPLLLAADRQLPTHLGLGLQRMPAGAQRQGMQRAARTAGESGPVVEYAGAVDLPGAPAVVLVADRVAHADSLAVGHRGVLPGRRVQLAGGLVYPLFVGRIGEKRAVAATTDVGVRVNPVASAAENARPAGAQPGQVGPDHVLLVGRIDELDPFPGKIQAGLAQPWLIHKLTGHRSTVGPLPYSLCGWVSWTSDRTPCICSSSMRGGAGIRLRRIPRRTFCGWPSRSRRTAS